MGNGGETPKGVATSPQPKGLFDDLPYYLKWWLVWGAVSGLVTIVDTTQFDFWPTKGFQIAIGLVVGGVCAVLFCLAQNTINIERVKAKSWALAIGVALLTKTGMLFLDTSLQERQARLSSEASAKAAENALVQLDQLKAEAARKHPKMPLAMALKEESAKINSKLLADAAGNKNEQLANAAGIFWGYYLVNTISRVEYCNEQGVDISAFISHFEKQHAREVERASAVLVQERITVQQLYGSMKKVLRASLEVDMNDISKSLGVDSRGACVFIARNGPAAATYLANSGANAEAFKVLMAPQ